MASREALVIWRSWTLRSRRALATSSLAGSPEEDFPGLCTSDRDSSAEWDSSLSGSSSAAWIMEANVRGCGVEGVWRGEDGPEANWGDINFGVVTAELCPRSVNTRLPDREWGALAVREAPELVRRIIRSAALPGRGEGWPRWVPAVGAIALLISGEWRGCEGDLVGDEGLAPWCTAETCDPMDKRPDVCF